MEGKTQETAAAMAGVCVRSARKWQDGPMPSETKQDRWWRTRSDPFDGVWEEEIDSQPVQTSVATRLKMKEPPMLSPQWATRSISRNPGGGRCQTAKVRTGMLRPADRFRRRLRRPDTVVRTGLSSRSSVAALAASNRSRTSGSRFRWPWRSMDSTKWGSAAFRRLLQMRSVASQTKITASRTASS